MTQNCVGLKSIKVVSLKMLLLNNHFNEIQQSMNFRNKSI